MASGPDRQQVHMEEVQEPEFSRSRHPFTRNFSQATHVLLTSCTRKEVLSYFAHFEPKTQEYLYKVYALVVAQIRENVIVSRILRYLNLCRKLLRAAEFGSICKEHQVFEVLDHVSDRALISATEVGGDINPEKVVREAFVRRKLQEIDEIKRKLEQVQEENNSLEAQLEVLRLDMKKAQAQEQGSENAIFEKVQNANFELLQLLN